MVNYYEIGIVGAGFSGLNMAIELIKANYTSIIIFEKADDVGGVWRDNVYPGCACDIKASLYSLKKEPNPKWTASYPLQKELLDYLKSKVVKYNLEQYIRYDTNILAMVFDQEKGIWNVTSSRGVFSIKLMILATGPQRLPYVPKIAGHNVFTGKSFHTSQWDKSLDLKNRRVAVIGTGASGIQIVPNIRDKVSQLFIFQRTPPWILPRWERKITLAERWLNHKFPLFQFFQRELNFWFLEFIGTSFLGNRWLHKLLTRIAINKIRMEVKDKNLVKKLTPNYKLGCKRILVSDNYYETFNKANVYLITDKIEGISDNSVLTNVSKHEVDIIIYATGFSVADADDYIQIIGLKNQIMNEKWREKGAEAYLGINVSNFPNVCFLLGPNSGLSHSSALHAMESQVSFILKYLSALRKHNENAYLDILNEVQNTYNENIQKSLIKRVWNSGCSSWFLNKQGKNTVIFPGILTKYRRLTSIFKMGNYFIGNNP